MLSPFNGALITGATFSTYTLPLTARVKVLLASLTIVARMVTPRFLLETVPSKMENSTTAFVAGFWISISSASSTRLVTPASGCSASR